MRIIFMGSGKLACPALGALLAGRADELVCVVTQPDRPGGRRQHLMHCPAKAFMQGKDQRVITPENVNAPAVVEELAALKPDLIVVADYGQFLKENVLALPPRGVLNIHPSLLPKYRGAAPIQWAIANGETETGVTLIYLNDRMDAGDILRQERVPIGEEDTAITLEEALAERGAKLLEQTLNDLRAGRVVGTSQKESEATYAPKLKKEDGWIEWERSAVEIKCRLRGFLPWPGTYCEVPEGSGHFLKIFKARIEKGQGRPGIVIQAHGEGPLVACGEDALRLLEVQPEGKKTMSGASYLNGHRLKMGELLG